ncbi:TadE/TadG family type IV pilus assembly protein [Mangrovactinospora gilvigrisea]|uniref:TadE/TadG family type IV pilus assembly protein n=1 Tax=Mangrovactinospora gilvigrisea TaxID=1428644 RepID=UPI000AED7FB6|nr:TadE/TadG family type IV pilus assembly protein [Mangrovactinospora gilvigrisea]
MRNPLRRRGRGERGVSTIEVVILAPLFITFVMFVVALGLLVNAQGKAYGAARDAARAGALQRDYGTAVAQAQAAAKADFGGTCSRLSVSADPAAFQSGGAFDVHVSCDVPLSGLNMLGIGAVKTIQADASAPVDTYRRTT